MIDVLRSQRSIRNYTDNCIGPEKTEIRKEAVLRSPSSRKINLWESILVDDREILKKLCIGKRHRVMFLEQAALGIV
jgi:nitroreductase